MERRDHHHPPTILKDRHIRNPNYLLTQHEASFTSPSSAIPSNNPPVHVPLPETYAHYDPFMPSTLRRRQGSYGREKEATQGRANDELPRTSAWNSTSSGHHRQQSAPMNAQTSHYMQPMPALAAPLSSPDVNRRRSISDASPLKYTEDSEVLAPPPSFNFRQPTQESPRPLRHPSTYPISSANKITSLEHMNGKNVGGEEPKMRPSGSMSISSLIEADRAPFQSSTQPSTSGYNHHNLGSKNYSNGTNAFTRDDRLSNHSIYYGQQKRARTPDEIRSNTAYHGRAKQQYPATSPTRMDFHRHTSPHQEPYKNRVSDSEKYQPMPRSRLQQSPSRITQSPYSDNKADVRSSPNNHRVFDMTSPGKGQNIRSCNSIQSVQEIYYPMKSFQGVERSQQPRERFERNRNSLIDNDSLASKNAANNQHVQNSSLGNSQTDGAGFWRLADRARDGSLGSGPIGRQPANDNYSGHSLRYPPLDIKSNSLSPDFTRKSRLGLEEGERSGTDRFSQSQSTDPNNHRRRSDISRSSAGQINGSQRLKNSSGDGTSRKLEELPHHKILAGITSENNKRAGRASPLPQAVQGAQAQLVNPGGNPSIKNEFGRMFSGLGSGLSNAPPNNGITTPSRLSPLPQRPHDGVESAPPHGNIHFDYLKLTRSGSYPGRKSRRGKDDDIFPGAGSGDGRSTPVIGLDRGSKRSKHSHAGHHHHHPPLSHHHHHHHHGRIEEEYSNAHVNNSTISKLQNSANGNITNPSMSQSVANNSFSHHHHHHHHHPAHTAHHHHHHHLAATANQGDAPIDPPVTTVISQSVRDSVSHLPRRHLGSQLYSPKLSLPPSATTPLDSKFGYRSRFGAIPRFVEKANCTFTVRVPRYYLTRDQRELICLDRNVCGTDIYTDDSDPIAAAIHAGWIRGEWADDVDVSLLQLEPLSVRDDNIASENTTFDKGGEVSDSNSDRLVMTQPSAQGPIDPPPERDLHIVLLILPALQKYSSSVRHGLKSRCWGATHDGMSYEILKLVWVDEGGGSRGEERSGAARRERLRAAMALTGMKEGAESNVSGLTGAAA